MLDVVLEAGTGSTVQELTYLLRSCCSAAAVMLGAVINSAFRGWDEVGGEAVTGAVGAAAVAGVP